MDTETVKQRIEDGIPGAEAMIEGEGCDLRATVIAEAFADKRLVERHKMVYATVDDLIRSGELHALAIKAHTPEQWRKKQEA